MVPSNADECLVAGDKPGVSYDQWLWANCISPMILNKKDFQHAPPKKKPLLPLIA